MVKNDPDFWEQAHGWSGANIRDCCELSYAMNISLREASAYIVPALMQDAKGIERLENLADGRFLSASKLGVYQKKDTSLNEITTKRSIDV